MTCFFATLGSVLWDLALAALGAYIGFRLGVNHSQNEGSRIESSNRTAALNNLATSLRQNSASMNQMLTEEFPKSQCPSYPLDTVALAMITFDAVKFLPQGTKWANQYNKLRFELDHINRKLLMCFLTARIRELQGAQSDEWAAVMKLIETTKVHVDEALAELESFNFMGTPL